jgi:hypothetical protein
LEVNLQPAIERKLKGPILCLTHRRSTSALPRSRPNPRLSRALQDSTKLVVHLENGNPGVITGTLKVNDNAANTPQVVSLSGQGIL